MIKNDSGQVLCCIKCGIALVPGTTWSAGLQKSKSKICRSCNSAKGRAWYTQNKEAALDRGRSRRISDPEAHREYQRAYKARDPEKWKKYHADWREKYASDPDLRAQDMVRWIKARAKQLNVPFDLTAEFLADRIKAGSCDVTGIPFELGVSKQHHTKAFSPSVDRITPGGGYTQDNVRVVVYIYNIARSDFSEGDVLRMAQALVAKSK